MIKHIWNIITILFITLPLSAVIAPARFIYTQYNGMIELQYYPEMIGNIYDRLVYNNELTGYLIEHYINTLIYMMCIYGVLVLIGLYIKHKIKIGIRDN